MVAFRHGVVGLCVLAILVAGLLGAHLHLCFDGREPPTTLHVLDSEHLEHHAALEHEHRDLDVDPLGKPLAKTYKVQLLTPWLLLAALLLTLSRGSDAPALSTRVLPCPSPPRRWRPPSQAPPR